MPCIVKQSTNSENETTKRKPGGDKMKEYAIPKLNFYSFNSNLLINTFFSPLFVCLFVSYEKGLWYVSHITCDCCTAIDYIP